MTEPIFVRLGLSTPLGLRAAATQAAVAAGISGVVETSVLDRSGEPVRACHLDRLSALASRTERITFFARLALEECLAGLPGAQLPELPCVLALPEPSAASPLDLAAVVAALRDATGPALRLDWSPRPCWGGRAAPFQALAVATQLLADGAPLVIVGGLDSGCDVRSLRALVRAGRVLGDDNFDGVIPGEGAGFVLLAREGHALLPGLRPLGRLHACANAREPAAFGAHRPTGAVAVTEVFRRLRRANAGRPRPQHLFSCQTGESFWARELNRAYLRNTELMPEPFRLTDVASSLGDAGAVSAIAQLAMAWWRSAPRVGRSPIERAMVYGAADSGAVGGCVIGSW